MIDIERRVQALLEHMLDQRCTPEEACADCPELLPHVRQRWEEMRRVNEQIEMLFPDSAREKIAPLEHASAERLPQIDGYHVEAVMGRGGMGVVYKAKHLSLNRVVAVKMLLSGPYASPQEVARFVRESRAVAELQHPHIVQIHDVGDVEGRPYFTMEFLEGGSLAQELSGRPQPARRAAEMISTLARAVHSAHAKGIVHRDLKPANILLTLEGDPKIADFGLARHLDGEAGLTMSDARVGTPSYMAPEQALGKLGIVGSAVDIYALGAMLYEMLTGRPPFRAETAIETERQVVMSDPVPPSRLNANVPRDLETICLKCLHKDPGRRYAQAVELAEDLERFLNGQPVRARPVSSFERASRWARRNKSLAAAQSGTALLLAVIVIGSVYAANHFRDLNDSNRELAREMSELAQKEAGLVVAKEEERARAAAEEKRANELRVEAQLRSDELRRTLYLTEMNLAGQAASVPSGLGRVNELVAHWGTDHLGQPDLRDWEWYYLHGLTNRSVKRWLTFEKSVHQLAWSPNGAKLASAADRTASIWNADDDERWPLRLVGHTGEVMSVAWSPDGQRLVSGAWDRTVRIWDAATGMQLHCLNGHTSGLYAVAWSSDGQSIASGGSDRTIRIWNADDGALRYTLSGHSDTVASLAWHPDNRRLASAAHDATVRIWDVLAVHELHNLAQHLNWVNQAAWSPDGAQLATVSNDQTARIWNAESGEQLQIIRGHTQAISSVAWSPDGKRLATASEDQTVKVWALDSGAEAFSIRGHAAVLTTVAWSPRGDRLVTGGYERSIKVWDVASGAERATPLKHLQPVRALRWHPHDQRLCASADVGGVIKIWDLLRQQELESLQADTEVVNAIEWHPADKRLATASRNGSIRIWTVGSGQEPRTLDSHTGELLSVAWSPDGRKLAAAGRDKIIRIWDVTSGQVVRVFGNQLDSVFAVAWSPDGRRLASASADRTVTIWDSNDGTELLCYRGHGAQVLTASWSGDGKKLASAGHDQSIHLWDASSGTKSRVLRGHTMQVAHVIWNADGTRIASAGREGMVKIWDTSTGSEALTFSVPENQASSVAWSPDGMLLAAVGEDQQVRLYDATPGYVAARSAQLLPLTERHLALDRSLKEDWRLRAEIFAGMRDWHSAAASMREYLLLRPERTWHLFDCVVAGPYSSDLNQRQPPEDADFFSIKTDSEQLPASATVNWKSVPLSAQGIVDFGVLTNQSEHVSGYALFPIYAVDDSKVAILIGTDDQARLWLNGELLYESSRARVAVPDEDVVAGMLKAGWNALLIRVANETESHEAFLRLSNAAADLARLHQSAHTSSTMP